MRARNIDDEMGYGNDRAGVTEKSKCGRPEPRHVLPLGERVK